MDATPNILIVDDSAGMRLALRKEIEKITTVPTIVEASNGREVLDALGMMQFDAIFLDINMPDLDGLTCLQMMRDSSEHTPVIMCTANADAARIRHARDSGASAYIVKPVTAMKIMEAVAPFVRLDGKLNKSMPEPDFRLAR